MQQKLNRTIAWGSRTGGDDPVAATVGEAKTPFAPHGRGWFWRTP